MDIFVVENCENMVRHTEIHYFQMKLYRDEKKKKKKNDIKLLLWSKLTYF
jgi:hypothetical protein